MPQFRINKDVSCTLDWKISLFSQLYFYDMNSIPFPFPGTAFVKLMVASVSPEYKEFPPFTQPSCFILLVLQEQPRFPTPYYGEFLNHRSYRPYKHFNSKKYSLHLFSVTFPLHPHRSHIIFTTIKFIKEAHRKLGTVNQKSDIKQEQTNRVAKTDNISDGITAVPAQQGLQWSR